MDWTLKDCTFEQLLTCMVWWAKYGASGRGAEPLYGPEEVADELLRRYDDVSV